MVNNRVSSQKFTGDAPAANSELSTEIQERIAERAYALYEKRGRVDGKALDDWLQAEQEFLEEKNGLALQRRRSQR